MSNFALEDLHADADAPAPPNIAEEPPIDPFQELSEFFGDAGGQLSLAVYRLLELSPLDPLPTWAKTRVALTAEKSMHAGTIPYDRANPFGAIEQIQSLYGGGIFILSPRVNGKLRGGQVFPVRVAEPRSAPAASAASPSSSAFNADEYLENLRAAQKIQSETFKFQQNFFGAVLGIVTNASQVRRAMEELTAPPPAPSAPVAIELTPIPENKDQIVWQLVQRNPEYLERALNHWIPDTKEQRGFLQECKEFFVENKQECLEILQMGISAGAALVQMMVQAKPTVVPRVRRKAKPKPAQTPPPPPLEVVSREVDPEEEDEMNEKASVLLNLLIDHCEKNSPHDAALSHIVVAFQDCPATIRQGVKTVMKMSESDREEALLELCPEVADVLELPHARAWLTELAARFPAALKAA
jgi:hypothetical protein